MPIGYNRDDTIVALATAAGSAPLAVIRLSGKKAFTVIDTIFFSKKKVSEAETHTILFGKIIYLSVVVDEVLVSVFKNPTSFTGEDVVEISCHGGSVVSQEIISILLSLGSSYALPGEFTYRAFLNGKIDLTKAEAISELINANTLSSKKRAIDGLIGKLNNKTNLLRQDLLDILSLLEVDIDFSEEGLSVVSKEQIETKLNLTITDINSIVKSYNSGKIYRDGVKVSIIGNTNVGKSSLLNYFLEENRAIVSDVHGTTRDFIEESININGINFKFVDTAGLRETNDVVELEGIARSLKHKESSDIVIHMFDIFEDFNSSIQALHHYDNGYKILNVINKQDLLKNNSFDLSEDCMLISCKTNYGLQDLKNSLFKLATIGVDLSESNISIQSTRLLELFSRCNEYLLKALNSLKQNLGNEFLAIDIRLAIQSLGEIIGETTSDDILNNIFGNFCIGK
ncbi:MAG: tRNA uridine-5-carboxymethylaminomethyl(34) synthesis GTPase MnmE [Bacteroidetes bacterium]|nr:tRNA uridine-5-carboxymethylaminomethyl(34) synthesis GTPase MnmE [Bacteroidota bacterium]